MQEDIVKKKTLVSLAAKLIMFILIIGYLAYFIYNYINTDFDWTNKINIFKVTLIFIIIIFLGIICLSNNKATLFFTIINYILICVLIVVSLIDILPKKEKPATKQTKKEKTIDEGQLICTGKTNTSDNTKIQVTYKEDEIKELIYTYEFDLKDKEKAQELVNNFDNKYKEFNTIYSEISINDKINIIFTYNIEDVEQQNLDKLDIKSYKELKEKELDKLTCQKKELD